MVIVWRVMEACSLACPFCGYSRDMPIPRRFADLKRVEAFGRVLRDVQRLTGNSILVSWLGGEPLAWPPLARLAQYFHEDCELRLGVTTNGLPLSSPALRSSLLQNFEQVTISIDGRQAYHDAIRGQPGLFDSIQAAVQHMQQEDLDNRLLLRVNTVLMRGNIGGFASFCEEMASWGFQELSFNQLGGIERPEFFASNRLLPEQVRRFVAELPALRERMLGRGMLICGSDAYLRRIIASTKGELLPIADCSPATEFLFIDTTGMVSPCSFTNDTYRVAIDDIPTAQRFLELPALFRRLRSCDRAAACDDCHATHVFAKFEQSTASDSAILKAPA